MTPPRVNVGISELEVARAPATLGALGLGSCVAVILHDPHVKVGGIAHVLLPSASVGRRRDDLPARFAPAAVATLIERLKAMGASAPRLTARLVGGASMFSSLQTPGTIQMGERNVVAAREALHRHRVRLTGELVGGDFGRSVEFDVESGRVKVTSYLHGTIEL